MVAIKNVLFFAISATAAVLPARDVTAIQNALNLVNSDTVSLTNAANNYRGGVTGSVPVQNASDKLNNDIKSAITTTNDSAASTESEADSILNYINGTLEPNVVKAIDAIIAKKSQFTAASLKNTVLNNLRTTQTNTNNLSDALIAKAPASRGAAGQAAKSQINADIQKGVDAYST